MTSIGNDDVYVNVAPGPASQPQGLRGSQLSCHLVGGGFEVSTLALNHLGVSEVQMPGPQTSALI